MSEIHAGTRCPSLGSDAPVRLASRLGGHLLIDQMLSEGTTLAFGVPGESYLSVLDGLFDHCEDMRLITTRHEGGAAMMAAAYARLTGQVGVCFVTRGPGATNASIGLHVAHQDGLPVVLLVGQVPTSEAQTSAFQEIDYVRMFSPIAKDVLVINRVERIPELTSRAFRVAASGRPGPVVLVAPEDVLLEQTTAKVLPPVTPLRYGPTEADLDCLMTWLSDAERPVALVGGSGWARESATQFQSFAEAHSLPVVTAVRQQDLIDNESPVYVGTLGLGTTPGLEAKLADADLLIIVGAMPDALTAKELPALRRDVRAPRLVHVYPDPDGLHHRRRADLAIVSSVGAFVQTLPNRAAGIAATRLAWLESLRLAWQERAWEVADTDISTRYVRALRRALGPDVVVTVGAGNYTAWPQRGWVYREFPSMVGTQAGSMGYGLPAAIAAKLVFPTRRVVAWAGDGCFQMTCQELATLVQYELDVLIIVVNNSCLGTIRMHQEARFPGRPVGTALINPDFAALARSYGVRGFRVFEPAEMEDALDEILAEPGAGLIEIVMGGSPA